MGKDKTALGIYEYGLKNVPHTNEDVKVSPRGQNQSPKAVAEISRTASSRNV